MPDKTRFGGNGIPPSPNLVRISQDKTFDRWQ